MTFVQFSSLSQIESFLSVQSANHTNIQADLHRLFLSVLAMLEDSEGQTEIERQTWLLTVMASIFLTE